MCKYSGPSEECAAKTVLRGMSQEGKDAILARHNDLRRRWAGAGVLRRMLTRHPDIVETTNIKICSIFGTE